jgi:Family of unknown function (DUF6221)
MTDLVAFLAARLDEDHVVAEAALAIDPAPWTADASDDGSTQQRSGAGAGLVIAADGIALWDCEGSNTLCMTAPSADHIARHDPARVLADIAAKRRIVETCADMMWKHEGGPDVVADAVLRDLAAIYAEHPDYDESWRA